MTFHNQNTVSLEEASGPDDIRVYAVGDIHGRIDLLLKMEALIQADIDKNPPLDWRIVYLGDYVDRGLCSRDVIEFLANHLWDERRIALAGNHDVGFVQFLESPNTGDVFATCGGEETARSYGVEMPFGSYESFERLQNDHQRLLIAVPKAHLTFLKSLRYHVSFGDFYFCHAGIRPEMLLEQQIPEDLTWIRSPFLESNALYSKIIVHGHTAVPEPELKLNRINIDTLAYKTGVLTALVINNDKISFLKTCDVCANLK